MFVSKDVTFVKHQAYYLGEDLDASLKGEQQSWAALPLPFTSVSSSETSTLISRGFLKPYRLIYLTRQKTQATQPSLNQPNDQSDAPTIGKS